MNRKHRTRFDKRDRSLYQQTLVSDPITKQSEMKSCDINQIVKNPQMMMQAALTAKPYFGDFSEPEDYHLALDRVLKADTAFSTLPSKLRKRFDNDPAELLKFLADEKNRDEAIQLGLVLPAEKPDTNSKDTLETLKKIDANTRRKRIVSSEDDPSDA